MLLTKISDYIKCKKIYQFNKKNLSFNYIATNSKNVKKAIKQTGATEVDVSSGVEDEFGTKSEKKILEFINILKENFNGN